MEPWMRGTHKELNAVIRAVVHALELAEEDVARWCEGLSVDELFARPGGLPPLAFHLRHIARSLDRLLTYADGRVLNEAQLCALESEMSEADGTGVLEEFRTGLSAAHARVRQIAPEIFGERRYLGRQKLPTTVAGLLIHSAEHTARHVGQIVTTAQIVRKR